MTLHLPQMGISNPQPPFSVATSLVRHMLQFYSLL